MTEVDPLLRRLERNSLLACGAMALAAWAVSASGVSASLGVLAGGLLALASYRGIKSGVDALTVGPAGEAGGRVKQALGLVKFFTRYGIIGLASYVTMARLRLPPVAVVAGASSIVAAVMVEALRGVRRR